MSEAAIQQRKKKGNKILQLTEKKEGIARHFIQHKDLSPLYIYVYGYSQNEIIWTTHNEYKDI